MSKKKRYDSDELELESQDSEESSEQNEPEVPKIPFAHWFNKQLSKGALKFYQEDAILIFLKKKGLSELEDEDSYNRALKNF